MATTGCLRSNPFIEFIVKDKELSKAVIKDLKADFEQLEEMIIRLSQLLIDFPDISELDMNPVLIKNGQAVAVDARILVSVPDVASPMHLVISPYPEEYETHETIKDGNRLFIRPVKPEDAPLFRESAGRR